jgi:hypothetical protein
MTAAPSAGTRVAWAVAALTLLSAGGAAQQEAETQIRHAFTLQHH